MSKQGFNFLSHHIDSFLCRYMHNDSLSGLEKMSTVCSLVSIYHIQIIFFCTNIWKLWYLIAIRFVIGENLLDSATAIQLWFYSNTLQKTSGFVRCISKIKYTSFVNDIKGMTLRITCLNKMYYDYVLLKVIYICNLLHHNTVHTAYVITYTVRGITFDGYTCNR